MTDDNDIEQAIRNKPATDAPPGVDWQALRTENDRRHRVRALLSEWPPDRCA